MTKPSPPRHIPVAGRSAVGAALATVLLLGGLAGCSASGSSTASSAGAPAGGQADSVKAPNAEAVAPPAVAGEPAKDGGSPQQAPAQSQQRSLIYTGSMSVKVPDVGAAADKAIDIANGQGGAVGGDKRTLDSDRSEAQLILRVPSEKFDATLGLLAKLGVEESRGIQTEDVTETIVDLDARLATQRASVERVRALLAKATTIGEVVSIESELTRREADLASLEQRKDKVAGLVALSTITLNLRAPSAPAPSGVEPEPGFLGGLHNGWSAFTKSIEVLLVIAGWLLPWAIAIGAPIWLVAWLLRRRRRPVALTRAVVAAPHGSQLPPPPPAVG